MSDRFATLSFERQLAAPVTTLWQAWTSPAARAAWSPPAPTVTIEFLEADTRIGGREVSLCKVEGYPDIRCEVGWLVLQPGVCSVNSELISSEGVDQSAALVTAHFSGSGNQSRVAITVQLSSLAEDMEAGYREGYSAALENLAGVAARTMVLERVIKAPREIVWGAWFNPESLPRWWGPEGYSCRTSRIDLRAGGEWVFDMIGPDGTVYPNHHRYGDVRAEESIAYALHWGENGPKHADAWVTFADEGGATRVTLAMLFSSQDEFDQARGFGAEELGLQTLGKLASLVEAG